MTEPELFIWKWVITHVNWVKDPDNPDVEYKGMVCAVIAATEEEARARMDEYENEYGLSGNWRRVGRLIKLRIAPRVVVAYHS